jgi:protein SCO1/2
MSSGSPRNVAVEWMLWGALVVVLVGVSSASMWKILRDRPATPAAGPSAPVVVHEEGLRRVVPDFALVDQNGNAVSADDLKGQIWVADFFFTHCPSKCPMVTMRMRDVQKALPDDAPVKLVSITVDPERDTPTVLADYAKQFGADESRWLFLTGDKQAIIKLCKEGFLLPATNDPNDHSLRLSLVDRDGTIRGWYDGTDESSVAALKREIKKLLGEVSP